MNEDFLKWQEEIKKRNEERLAQFENRTERQKLADSARGMLFDLTLQIYTQMNGHNLTAIEHEKHRIEFAREILDMSDELALSIIKNIDITLLRQSWHDHLESLGFFNPKLSIDKETGRFIVEKKQLPKEPEIFQYIELSRVMEEAEKSLNETSPVDQAKQMLAGKEIMNKELPKVLKPVEDDILTSQIKNMIIDLSSRSIYDEYKYDKNEEEINNVQSSIKAEIQHLSRDLLKNLIQAFDGKRMMEQRVITNAAHVGSNDLCVYDHYTSLFAYLNKMAVKEAENIMKDSEKHDNIESSVNPIQPQANKDSEEIKPVEESNSLNEALNKEQQARDAWRKNSSSYELYQNYKNSIAERLEIQKENETSERSAIDDYAEKKQVYEEVSASKELIEQVKPKSSEEIDIDLDDFEDEERRILNSKHYSEQQKKEMIEKLYSKFDEDTKQNPETSGRHI